MKINLSALSPYVAGVGLVGLAVYQITTGDFAGATASIALAAADFGIKLATPAPPPAKKE